MTTNEKKAKEIAVKWKAKGLPYNAIYDSCLEMAQWKDDKAVELYAQELRQFRNLLIKINPDAKDLIDIEQSITDFKTALNQ